MVHNNYIVNRYCKNSYSIKKNPNNNNNNKTVT